METDKGVIGANLRAAQPTTDPQDLAHGIGVQAHLPQVQVQGAERQISLFFISGETISDT